MTDTYQTIKKQSEGLFKDRGSKFFAYAYPIKNEPKAKEKINQLKKQYHDARHHCFAYKIGVQNPILRANDDGEPSNSAGKPILNQIEAHDLTNVLIVVVRYFGGTLLGVGGLINAYRTASQAALKNTQIIKKTINDTVHLHFEYQDMNPIMQLIKKENIEIIEQNFTTNCQLKIEVRKKHTEKIINQINQLKTAIARIN